jgi:hypothetical protein
MLLILISLTWCAIAVLVLALCFAAAGGDHGSRLPGRDARAAAT